LRGELLASGAEKLFHDHCPEAVWSEATRKTDKAGTVYIAVSGQSVYGAAM
jgi:hypothetical protein